MVHRVALARLLVAKVKEPAEPVVGPLFDHQWLDTTFFEVLHVGTLGLEGRVQRGTKVVDVLLKNG